MSRSDRVADCPADMPVEIERCVPVSARIVTELRSLPSWPHAWSWT